MHEWISDNQQTPHIVVDATVTGVEVPRQYVQDGKISRGNRVRLVRDGIVAWEGTISSLRRFKDDVRDVDAGFECGISLENFNDIKVGDTIEAFKIVETMRKLD